MAGFTMLIIYFFLLSYITITTTLSLDTITLGQSIKDGEKLVSAGNVFELGFFIPGKSSSRYLGIWYKNDVQKSVAWVANRNTPISDSSGFLSINAQGSLVLRMNSTNDIVWSSNASTTLQNPVAVLLESGNLVVKDGNNNDPDNFLWQSFDYPCDTFLPGMKIGQNLVTGMEWFLSSWKSIADPAPGDFTFKIDPRGSPQLFARKGTEIVYRSGSWNGLRFTGTPQLEPNPIFTYDFVSNEKEVFYTFDIRNISVPARTVMSSSGYLLPSKLIDQNWERFSAAEIDRCEIYDFCGSYASCNINKFPDICECLEGFTPKSPGHWTEGCVRRASLNCYHSDGFLKHEEVKLPDTSHSWVDNNISLAECKKLCLSNCSCTAYANSDVREGGTGCLLWFSDLLDIRNLATNGQPLYVRVAASELDNIDLMRQPIARKRQLSEKKRVTIVVTCVVSATGLLVLGWIIFMCKRKLRIQGKTDNSRDINDNNEESKTDEMELLIYDLNTIAKATDNFADKNKLGEGGFGPVYKGTLMEGQEIAIKRLSKYFGLAKTFRGDQTKGETNRVVGTYGYMSPEYAIDGVFSIKSDIFSFGVLVLEMVSGKKNRGFCHADHNLNLIGHAWRLWNEERANGKVHRKPNIGEDFDRDSSNESIMDDGAVAKSNSQIMKIKSSADVYEKCNLIVNEPACYKEVAQMNEKKLAMKEELMMIKRNQAQSSVKAEYIAAAVAPKQAKWIKRTNEIVWSSNASTSLQNPVAVLLESGNLVVKDGNDNNPDNFLWHSFDHPGDFTLQIDYRGSPQLFVRNGSKIVYRPGSWNGLRWTGTPYLETNPVYTYEFVLNEKEIYYTFDIQNISVPARMVMSSSGYLQPSKWIDQNWERFSVTEIDRCEYYDLCGSYASCNINKYPDVCECLEGFTPKSPGHWTEGCVRRAPLHCNQRNGFLKHKEVKLPDTSHSWVDNNISLVECKKLCLKSQQLQLYSICKFRCQKRRNRLFALV
ncbi:hypothetical protein LWI28_019980 [Acer negundo]|uniref:Receptor-like serine/threonine-protein kinase n=1 Tax=Acer negundo TaxID=4023 RepID=A0AAD5J5R6_ACENE|nr:hypothetical protein LWI28_019980 [Acer negundo]